MCFTSDNDLDKHFILLNQTKLSISEIHRLEAVKDMTKKRMRVCCSALEIARNAGWMIRFRILKARADSFGCIGAKWLSGKGNQCAACVCYRYYGE